MARDGAFGIAVVGWIAAGTGLLALGLFANGVAGHELAAQVTNDAARRASDMARSVWEKAPPTQAGVWLVEPNWCPPLPGTSGDQQVSDQCEEPGRSMPAAPAQFETAFTPLALVTLANRIPRCEPVTVGGDYVLCASPAQGEDQAVIVASSLSGASRSAQLVGLAAIAMGGAALLAAPFAARLITRRPLR